MKKRLTRLEATEQDTPVDPAARNSVVVRRSVCRWGGRHTAQSAALDGALYGTLTQAHNELLDLMDQATDSDEDERATSIRQLGIALLSHSYATKRSLFAALLHFEDCSTLAQQVIDEQNQLVRLLYQSLTAVSGSPVQADLLSRLGESLRAHVGRVESELYVLSHRCLPRLQVQNLQDRYTVLNVEYRLQLDNDFSQAQKPRAALESHIRLLA